MHWFVSIYHNKVAHISIVFVNMRWMRSGIKEKFQKIYVKSKKNLNPIKYHIILIEFI